jgi:hypothetical protein
MHSVYLNSSNQNLNFDSFYREFISICNGHKENERAMAFALILYDFENQQISKILKDTEYWLSLNQISGKFLTVFSFNHKPVVRYRRKKHISNFDLEPPLTQYLTSVTHFNNPSTNSELLIDKYFGKNIKIKYPAVLFFQTNEEKVIDYSIVELDEQEIEKSFLELKNYILEAVKALKLIKKENKNNIQQIFNNVKGNVEGKRTKIVTVKKIKNLISITGFLSTIMGLGSKN